MGITSESTKTSEFQVSENNCGRHSLWWKTVDIMRPEISLPSLS